MPSVGRLFLISASGFALCLSGCGPEPIGSGGSGLNMSAAQRIGTPLDAPEIPEAAVLRPFFQTSEGSNDAGDTIGTAFGASILVQAASSVGDSTAEQVVVLTAYSLLGPDGGLKRWIKPFELNSVVHQTTLGDAFGSFDSVLQAGPFVVELPSGQSPSEETAAGNVVAIRTPTKSRIRGLPLSPDEAQVGQRVWMSTALFAGAPPSQRQHPAKITRIDEAGNLIYEFVNERLSFEGTVGAPILNDDGQVVAVNLGQLKSDNDASPSAAGRLPTGVGNPVTRFLPLLKKALQTDAAE